MPDSGPGPELDNYLEDAVSPNHVDVTSEHIRGAVRGGHRHHGLGLGVLEGRLPLEAEADRHGEVGLLRLIFLDQSEVSI